ncbi:MAG: hypothetical protein QXN08_08270 [Nitrososphaerales archaeon]
MRSRKIGMPVPPYLWAKGLIDDSEWVNAYIMSVLNWPHSCTLTAKEKHLIGLGKAVAYLWEPGVLIHVDQALSAGANEAEINDAIRISSLIIGLADLDYTLQQLNFEYQDHAKSFGYTNQINLPAKMLAFLDFDPKWFQDFLTTIKIIFQKTSLEERLQNLLCLAVSAVKGWKHGIQVFSERALKNGATSSEVTQVIASVFKTAVSTSMQVGFRYPCYTPDMSKYRLIIDSYMKSRAKYGEKNLDFDSML